MAVEDEGSSDAGEDVADDSEGEGVIDEQSGGYSQNAKGTTDDDAGASTVGIDEVGGWEGE